MAKNGVNMAHYCIVGNGVAGTAAANAVRRLDPNGDITIFTDEDYPHYYRIRLPDLIAGEITEDDLIIHKPDWYVKKNIYLHLKDAIKEVYAENKTVVTIKGAKYCYDTLLLADGSHCFVPPINGSEKQGVFTLRTIKDAHAIAEYAEKAKKAILIGGGLLGLEAGNGLRRLGIDIMVIEIFPRLLPRQMDIPGAAVLQRMLEEVGFAFRLGAQVQEILGNTEVEGVLLKDGTILEGDMVLFSAGIRPNLDLAKKIGLKINKGVVVDDLMATSKKDIYAAGDSVEHNGRMYGIWPASLKQGEVAGTNMAGGNTTYKGTVMSNTLKVVGIDLTSAGEINVEDKYESLVESNNKIYRKIVVDQNRIIGCILLGDLRGSREIQYAIERKRDIGDFKNRLLTTDFDYKRLLG